MQNQYKLCINFYPFLLQKRLTELGEDGIIIMKKEVFLMVKRRDFVWEELRRISQ